MKTRRPAYALNEILILMAVVVTVMAFSAKMGWTLIREIPMSVRYFNTQASTQSMLDALREDVETARNLRLSTDENDPNAQQIAIDGPAGRLFYTFADGQMQRSVPDPNAPGHSCWTLPNVRIEWQVRQEAGRPAALEIQSRQQRTFMGKERINFRQANLFFLGIQKNRSSREN